MSGAFPSTPKPASVVVKSNTPTQYSVTQSGRRSVRQLGAHRWQFTCTWPSTMSRDQFMPIMGFVMDQEGMTGAFTFVPPDLATPRGEIGGTPVTNGAGQTGKTLITDGWPNNRTVLKAGDVFSIVGFNKVYMVTADAVTNGSGQVTISIAPALTQETDTNLGLTVSDVPFTVQLSSGDLDYAVSGPLLYQQTLEMVEVV